ncbi:MAG TPA: hypothetical protein VD772_06965 [Anseongella sp.]|nr:hypothetical protein [Anseongella sp.]
MEASSFEVSFSFNGAPHTAFVTPEINKEHGKPFKVDLGANETVYVRRDRDYQWFICCNVSADIDYGIAPDIGREIELKAEP